MTTLGLSILPIGVMLMETPEVDFDLSGSSDSSQDEGRSVSDEQ